MVRAYQQKDIDQQLYPYPINYHKQSEVTTDVLVIGAGPAGCSAAIAAAKKGVKVAIVEKGATIRAGDGRSGCDHWLHAVTNPCSKMSPEKHTEMEIKHWKGYANGMGRYICARDSWDCLLELEKMGVKIRDNEDVFKGEEFRDEETKLLFAGDLTNKFCIRWNGSGAQPAFKKELERLGVEIYDRIHATCLLTEGGKPGARITGATGINTRTAEFMIFKAKAVVMCTSQPARISIFSQEWTGFTSQGSNTNAGTGHVMGWRAGAEFTMFEKTAASSAPLGWPVMGQGGHGGSWEPCNMVDANGKEIPWQDGTGKIINTYSERHYPAPEVGATGYGYGKSRPDLIKDLDERIEKGEYSVPLYADLPSMPEKYKNLIWDQMIAQEGRGRMTYRYTYGQHGFDPEKDMLQSYTQGFFEAEKAGPSLGYTGPAQWREFVIPGPGGSGGFLVDWDLKTNVPGLYVGGQTMFCGNTYDYAVTTGRWAGRHAGDYAQKADKPELDSKQVQEERERILAPLMRDEGLEWKTFNNAICRVFQFYHGAKKSEGFLKVGLIFNKEFKESEAQQLFARDPHELMRCLEALDILTIHEMVLHACLARKASSTALNFISRDYPEMDPPEWDKFLTIKRDNGEAKIGEMPKNFWGDLKEGYEAHYSPEE